jgi:hypothetical protein
VQNLQAKHGAAIYRRLAAIYRRGKKQLLQANQQSNPLSAPIPSTRNIATKGHLGLKSKAA